MIAELPTDFPSESVTILLPFLRGKLPSDATEKRLAATAGWNIVGYGIGLGLPSPAAGTLPMPGGDASMTPKQLADHLESLQKAHTSGASMSIFSSIPWRKLVDLLLPLVLNWAEAA